MIRYLLPAILFVTPAMAGDAKVVEARATQVGDTWRFDVTVAHEDTGWDHYADGWSVNAPDGTQLGFRELLHPHVNEQPFTRSLSGVSVPAELSEVVIRVHDNVHGWAAEEYRLKLR